MDGRDICLDAGKGMFNFRVGAIIIQDGAVLMARAENSPYYYSIGGRVKFGETAEEAVIREVLEETGVNARIDRLGFIHENFFRSSGLNRNAVFHELGLFYYIKPGIEFNSINEEFTERGSVFKLSWLNLNSIRDMYLYPEFFKTELKNPSREVKSIVVNEL